MIRVSGIRPNDRDELRVKSLVKEIAGRCRRNAILSLAYLTFNRGHGASYPKTFGDCFYGRGGDEAHEGEFSERVLSLLLSAAGRSAATGSSSRSWSIIRPGPTRVQSRGLRRL